MYPRNYQSFDWMERLRSFINNAYWPLYGEINILDEIQDKCSEDENSCPTKSGKFFSFILLVPYMIIGKKE